MVNCFSYLAWWGVCRHTHSRRSCGARVGAAPRARPWRRPHCAAGSRPPCPASVRRVQNPSCATHTGTTAAGPWSPAAGLTARRVRRSRTRAAAAASTASSTVCGDGGLERAHPTLPRVTMGGARPSSGWRHAGRRGGGEGAPLGRPARAARHAPRAARRGVANARRHRPPRPTGGGLVRRQRCQSRARGGASRARTPINGHPACRRPAVATSGATPPPRPAGPRTARSLSRRAQQPPTRAGHAPQGRRRHAPNSAAGALQERLVAAARPVWVPPTPVNAPPSKHHRRPP